MCDRGDPFAYTEQSFLGRGGSGDVFSARDPSSGQLVALKKIHINHREAKHLAAELALMRTLKHANVVTLHASFMVEDQLWLVMELMDGGDLTSRIEVKAPFTEPQVEVH